MQAEKSFISWMRSTNQIYSGDEYQLRFGIFQANQRYVSSHNKGKHSWTLALNKFSAMTPAEYRALLGVRGSVSESNYVPAQSSVKAPDALDWRDKGVVNPIKDQGQCGSCWAFSAIQAMESAWAINHNTLYSLSESNLVDCTCEGCNGGVPSSAYDYVISKQGGKFQLESDYPYTPVRNNCHFDAAKAPDAQIEKHISSLIFSESKLQEHVAEYGPATVCIDASQASFQLYTGGIYDDSSCSSLILDHAVGCIGYGSESGTDYWIIRNSWGEDWGEAGYIRIRRNHHNRCGVATRVSIPIPV